MYTVIKWREVTLSHSWLLPGVGHVRHVCAHFAPRVALSRSCVRAPLSRCLLLLCLVPSFALLKCRSCWLLKKVCERDISCLCVFEDFYFHMYLVVWLGKRTWVWKIFFSLRVLKATWLDFSILYSYRGFQSDSDFWFLILWVVWVSPL